ncbi:MAG: hypothetical protein KGJ34_00520 [Patescibacteria group bacterium]|nr:hypothetical protein [Patescibacteria group bacterium]
MSWFGSVVVSIGIFFAGLFGFHQPQNIPPITQSSVQSSTTTLPNTTPSTQATPSSSVAELMQQIGCSDMASCVSACSNSGMPPACVELQTLMSVQQTKPNQQVQSQQTTQTQTQAPSASLNEDFIVVTPVDLSKISSISTFRSCAGHDYSGLDVQGVMETNRSMKHYFMPLPAYGGTKDQIAEYAPFDGTVVKMFTEQTPIGQQVWIDDSSDPGYGGNPPPNVWNIIFFHLNPLPSIAVGTHVHAGDLIGYADIEPPLQTFDIGLEKYVGSNGIYNMELDSIFNHMSANVLETFAQYGATPGDMILTKAYRDANPCNFNSVTANDFVTLSH